MANELSGIVNQIRRELSEVGSNFFNFRNEAKLNDNKLFDITKDAYNAIKNNKKTIDDVREDFSNLRDKHNEIREKTVSVERNLNQVISNQRDIAKKVDQTNTEFAKFRRNIITNFSNINAIINDVVLSQRRQQEQVQPERLRVEVPKSAYQKEDAYRRSLLDRMLDYGVYRGFGGGLGGTGGSGGTRGLGPIAPGGAPSIFPRSPIATPPTATPPIPSPPVTSQPRSPVVTPPTISPPPSSSNTRGIATPPPISDQPYSGDSKEPTKIKIRGRKIDEQSFFDRAVQKIRNSKLNGFVPKDGARFGITTGSPQEWARLYTMLLKQESGGRIAQVGPDGRLIKFRTTPAGEKSYGPLQFNIGEYGLKSWSDVNNPDRNIDALIKVGERWTLKSGVISGRGRGQGYYSGWGGYSAYFGSLRRPNETLQHSKWFQRNIKVKSQEQTQQPQQPQQREQPQTPESLIRANQNRERNIQGYVQIGDQRFKAGTGGRSGASMYYTEGVRLGGLSASGPKLTPIFQRMRPGRRTPVVNVRTPDYDPLAGRKRSQIQFHPAIGGVTVNGVKKLISAGCIAVDPKEYDDFIKAYDKYYKENKGNVYLQFLPSPPGQPHTFLITNKKSGKTTTLDKAVKNFQQQGDVDPETAEKRKNLLPKSERKNLGFDKEEKKDSLTPKMLVNQKQGRLARHRKNPIDPELETKLNYAAAKSGVEVDIFSGSQTGPGASRPPGASPEHNKGGAADFDLFYRDKNGKRIKINPHSSKKHADLFLEFTKHAARAGIRSAGTDYMGPGRIHMGISRNNPAAYKGFAAFRTTWRRYYSQFLKEGLPEDIARYSAAAIAAAHRKEKERIEKYKIGNLGGPTPEKTSEDPNDLLIRKKLNTLDPEYEAIRKKQQENIFKETVRREISNYLDPERQLIEQAKIKQKADKEIKEGNLGGSMDDKDIDPKKIKTESQILKEINEARRKVEQEEKEQERKEREGIALDVDGPPKEIPQQRVKSRETTPPRYRPPNVRGYVSPRGNTTDRVVGSTDDSSPGYPEWAKKALRIDPQYADGS